VNTMIRTAFRVGTKLVCIRPGTTLLVKGQPYTVIDNADLGPPSALVEVKEFPGLLFHPDRFVREVT